jgi:acetyltransferase-like isoleucine patch superfamily enzyme
MKPIIYENVEFDGSPTLGYHTILGELPQGRSHDEMPTRLGSGAVIRSHTVIYAGNRIGNDFKTGHHVMIREENSIGDYVSIGSGTNIEHHVIIENSVRIHSLAFISEYCHLEEGCWLGPKVVLTNAKYPNQADTKNNLKGVRVCRRAVVGANVTILPGSVIGPGAVIGAGSVVLDDVPSGAVAYGNPARIKGKSFDLGYSMD